MKYLRLNTENEHSKIFKGNFSENLTYLETIMLQMKREKLKYKHNCLHESILTKMNIFDEHLLDLEKERKDIGLQTTFLNLFAITLEEELIILNDFNLLEDQYSYNLYIKTVKHNDQVKIVNISIK